MEGGREWWGVVVLGLVFVLGCSFVFVGTRFHSWQGLSCLGTHHQWVGVVVICGGLLLSLGRVICRVGSLFVGLGGHLGVPCRRLWVLGVIVGYQAVVWGW